MLRARMSKQQTNLGQLVYRSVPNLATALQDAQDNSESEDSEVKFYM